MSKRRIWNYREVLFMLNMIKERNFLILLNSKSFKAADMYLAVELGMKEAGFDKTAEEIKVKWKNLKFVYTNIKKNNTSVTDRWKYLYYEELDELLGSTTNSVVGTTEMEAVTRENCTRMLVMFQFLCLSELNVIHFIEINKENALF